MGLPKPPKGRITNDVPHLYITGSNPSLNASSTPAGTSVYIVTANDTDSATLTFSMTSSPVTPDVFQINAGMIDHRKTCISKRHDQSQHALWLFRGRTDVSNYVVAIEIRRNHAWLKRHSKTLINAIDERGLKR